jgi:hypothetical protein
MKRCGMPLSLPKMKLWNLPGEVPCITSQMLIILMDTNYKFISRTKRSETLTLATISTVRFLSR